MQHIKMRTMWFVVALAVLVSCDFVSAAEVTKNEARLISDAAMRWLVFDDSGRTPLNDPYIGKGYGGLSVLRTQLRSETEIPLETFVSDKEQLAAPYNVSSKTLRMEGGAPSAKYQTGIHISPDGANKWKVELQSGELVCAMEVSRDGRGYYVKSIQEVWTIDW